MVKGGGVASESPAGTMAGMRNAETQKPVATVLTKLGEASRGSPCDQQQLTSSQPLQPVSTGSNQQSLSP